jgi:hypothetical protein
MAAIRRPEARHQLFAQGTVPAGTGPGPDAAIERRLF